MPDLGGQLQSAIVIVAMGRPDQAAQPRTDLADNLAVHPNASLRDPLHSARTPPA